MKNVNRKWLYLQNQEEEILMRADFSKPEGEIQVPLVGKVRFKTNGKKIGFTSLENCRIHCFDDGEVLIRTSTLGVKVTSSGSLNLLYVGLFFIGILGLVSFSNIFNLTFAAAPKKEVRSVTPLYPKPISTVVPRVMPTSIPTIVPKATPSHSEKPKSKKTKSKTQVNSIGLKKMQEHEKSARKAFLRGELSQASFDMAEAKAVGGSLSPNFFQFESELEYAICKQSYGNNEWETAAQHCQTAALRMKNERANKILNQLAMRTKRLYLEGYAMEGLNTKAAIARYKDALRSGVAGDPYAKKASIKLKVIGVVSSH